MVQVAMKDHLCKEIFNSLLGYSELGGARERKKTTTKKKKHEVARKGNRHTRLPNYFSNDLRI